MSEGGLLDPEKHFRSLWRLTKNDSWEEFNEFSASLRNAALVTRLVEARLKSCWASMLNRCDPRNAEAYPHYAGRGISVCDRWKFGDGNRSGLSCLVADMGAKPSSSLSLDRINNDGNYEPGNCRWATASEQALNKRRRKIWRRRFVKPTLEDALRVAREIKI